MEAIGNTGAGVHSQNFNRRAKPFSKTTESTNVRGVARYHTPDSIAQPKKPHVIALTRRDTTSPSNVSEVTEEIVQLS